MLKRRMISSALLCLAVACQGRGLQPVAQSATTPTTNPTPATSTSVSEVAPAQPSTTATTEPDTPETVTRPRPATTRVADVAPVAPSGGAGGTLACIRSYEQGAAGYATNTGNGYYGAYQFDLATWRSVGGAGLPSDATPAEQDMRAGMLLARRGLAPWPTPAVMCD